MMEFLILKGGYTGSSESTLVKMPHCWKSHVTVKLFYLFFRFHMDVSKKSEFKSALITVLRMWFEIEVKPKDNFVKYSICRRYSGFCH